MRLLERPRARRKYCLADIPALLRMSEYADGRFELIEGEIVAMPPTGLSHGRQSGYIIRFLVEYAERTGLGIVTADTGYFAADDDETLLGPDVAFIRIDRLDDPDSHQFVPAMPDLAVEVKSPNDTYAATRRKAELYLRRGSRLVWLVYPDRHVVEVCRLDDAGELQIDFVPADGALSGEDVLPGFTLELSRVFS
ncbi:MAG: Uma2 family endonuclease [Chloroflexi bacterium]|nr:Uma2 family endonuclease [Chloroflexota bacterium]